MAKPANGSGPAPTGTPRRTSGRCSTRGGGLPTRYRVPGRGHPPRTEPRPTPSSPPEPAPARRQLGPPRTQGGAAPPAEELPNPYRVEVALPPWAQAGGGLAGGSGSVRGEQVSSVRFAAALGCHWRHGCRRSRGRAGHLAAGPWGRRSDGHRFMGAKASGLAGTGWRVVRIEFPSMARMRETG